MNPLRQSTASQSRIIGPMVDDTDFKSLETSLTINAADVELMKNGAASVAKNSGGGTHRVNGDYGYTFDATDTDTVGELEASISVAGALVAKKTFWVFNSTVFDSLYADNATLLTSRDIGQVYESTVNAIDTTTRFDMDVSIVSDSNWVGNIVTVEDVGTGETVTKWVTAVDQANDRITIDSVPPFTVAVGDILRVESRIHPTFALNLYDVTRRSESTADTDSILNKLIALFRVALRKDAAITTDNAQEIGEINADDGAGVGVYSHTVESQQAMGDRLPTSLSANGNLNAHVKEVNDVVVKGSGSVADPWNPV